MELLERDNAKKVVFEPTISPKNKKIYPTRYYFDQDTMTLSEVPTPSTPVKESEHESVKEDSSTISQKLFKFISALLFLMKDTLLTLVCLVFCMVLIAEHQNIIKHTTETILEGVHVFQRIIESLIESFINKIGKINVEL